jgi:GGDEF domain-containing protein
VTDAHPSATLVQQPFLNEPHALDASIERAGRHHQQLLDGLTNLPGPALLIDRTWVAIARAGRSQRTVGVIVFDEVRRADGRSQDFATFVDLLRRSVRADDTVARLRGLTFVVVLNDISDPDRPARVAQRLLQGAGVQCRLGIALGTAPTTAEELLSFALREAQGPLGGAPEPEPQWEPWSGETP